jgi:hypothetical protein
LRRADPPHVASLGRDCGRRRSVRPARLCPSRHVVETGNLSVVTTMVTTVPPCRRGGACPARPCPSRHVVGLANCSSRHHIHDRALRHGRGRREESWIEKSFAVSTYGEIDRGGRPVPSVVGRDSGRGTRHAAGSPPHTAAPTARGARREELWLEQTVAVSTYGEIDGGGRPKSRPYGTRGTS